MFKRKLFNLSVFTISLFVLEGVSLVFMGFNFFIYYFLLELILIILLGSIIFFFNNTMFDRIYLSILLSFSTILLIANTLYYLANGNIFSLLNIGAAKQLTFKIFLTYLEPKVLIVMFIILALSLFVLIYCNAHFKVKKDNSKNIKKKNALLSSAALICGICLYIGSSSIVKQYDTNVQLNYTSDSVCEAPSYNFRRFGMLGYYIREIKYLFKDPKANYDDLKKFYLATKCPGEENVFTGLCKDMNVITIMIESGAREMVNEVLTPNLYNLINNEGINFSCNYQKQATSVSEFIGITGSYPICSSYTTTIDCETPFGLPSILNKEGYETVFCHDVDASVDMYNRMKIMPRIGFKNNWFHKDLYKNGESCWTWDNFSLDTENTSKLLNNLKEKINSKFYLHYTTLTMHPNYNLLGSHPYVKKIKKLYEQELNNAKEAGTYKNPFINTKYSSDVSSFDLYMMKCMDFDKSLGQILQALKDNNILDNTLIVLYGDHDLYGKGNSLVSFSQMYRNIHDIKDIRLYDTVLTISNPKLLNIYNNLYGKTTFDSFSCANVIVPSILHLLGIKYSPRMYFGQSAFDYEYDVNQPMYSYALGNYINRHYLSEIGNKIDRTYLENGTKDKFLNSCFELYQRKGKINSIYKTNFFFKYNIEEFIAK